MNTIYGTPKSASNTARRVIRGLKLSIGIIAATVAYAAIITPILIKIIHRNKSHKEDVIDVTWEDDINDAGVAQ